MNNRPPCQGVPVEHAYELGSGKGEEVYTFAKLREFFLAKMQEIPLSAWAEDERRKWIWPSEKSTSMLWVRLHLSYLRTITSGRQFPRGTSENLPREHLDQG